MSHDQLTIGITKITQKYGEINTVETGINKDLQEVTVLLGSLKDMQKIGINVDDALEKLEKQKNAINCDLEELGVLKQSNINTMYCGVYSLLLEFVTYIAKITPEDSSINRIKQLLGGETNNGNNPSNGGHYPKNHDARKPNYTLDNVADLISKFNDALEVVDSDLAKLHNLITLISENDAKGFKVNSSENNIENQADKLDKVKNKKYDGCTAFLTKVLTEVEAILAKANSLERRISGQHTPLVFEE